jgi:outer membrane protein TolC
VTGGPALGSPVAVAIPLGFRETYRTALSLSQVVFSSGSLSASLRAAELNLSAAVAEETRTRQAVMNNVQVSYFTAQRAFGRLRVADENLGISRQHLKQVEAFFQAGFVAINEVLRVQVSIAQAEQEKIGAENAVRNALAGLQRAVGNPVPRIIDERRENPPTLELEGDRISIALKMRPELAGLTAARKAAEETARAYAGRSWPQVLLQGEVSRTEDQFPPSNDDDWNVSLVLQWRLYDHGEIKSRVSEAKALARELLHRYKDLENQVVQDVTVASSDLESAMARMSVAREQVAKAREDYRIAMLRYETQVGTNLDVLDARASLVTALNSLVDSVYDASIAESRLVFAVGQGKLVF